MNCKEMEAIKPVRIANKKQAKPTPGWSDIFRSKCQQLQMCPLDLKVSHVYWVRTKGPNWKIATGYCKIHKKGAFRFAIEDLPNSDAVSTPVYLESYISKRWY